MRILSWLHHRLVQNVSFLLTSYLYTSKIARTVALNNPIAPCLIEMKSKIFSSEKLEFFRYDVIRLNERYEEFTHSLQGIIITARYDSVPQMLQFKS